MTDAERGVLLAARRGEALLVAGSARVHFEVVSSAHEDHLAGSADSTVSAPLPRQHTAPSDGGQGPDWTSPGGMDEEDLF